MCIACERLKGPVLNIFGLGQNEMINKVCEILIERGYKLDRIAKIKARLTSMPFKKSTELANEYIKIENME